MQTKSFCSTISKNCKQANALHDFQYIKYYCQGYNWLQRIYFISDFIICMIDLKALEFVLWQIIFNVVDIMAQLLSLSLLQTVNCFNKLPLCQSEDVCECFVVCGVQFVFINLNEKRSVNKGPPPDRDVQTSVTHNRTFWSENISQSPVYHTKMKEVFMNVY